MEGRVAIVVASDEAAIDKNLDIAEELRRTQPVMCGVPSRWQESRKRSPVPTNAGFSDIACRRAYSRASFALRRERTATRQPSRAADSVCATLNHRISISRTQSRPSWRSHPDRCRSRDRGPDSPCIAELKLPTEIEEELLARQRVAPSAAAAGIPLTRAAARPQAERAANEDAESATPEQRRSRRENIGMELPFRAKC